MRKVILSLALFSMVAGCAPDSSLQISAVLPLSGPWQIYGQPVRKGVELAYEELKASPDLPFSLDLVISDTESDAAKANKLLREAFDSGAVAVVGGVTSAEALEMVAVADRFDRVLLSPSASNPQLTGISRNFYRVFPSDAKEGTTMGNFGSQKLGLQTAVIVAKEETYAAGIQAVFASEFERNGGQVTEIIEYPEGAGDFSGLIARVVSLEPNAVYLAAYADDIGKMINELRAKNFQGRILTTSAFSTPEAIEQTGDDSEGVFLTQAGFEPDSEDPKVIGFVEAYRAKYGFAPDLYAAHGYDALMVLVEGLKQGADVPSDLWKKVRGLRDYFGVTGAIQFDERGDVQKFPRVYVVQNGTLVDYERDIEARRRALIDRLHELQEQQRKRGN